MKKFATLTAAASMVWCGASAAQTPNHPQDPLSFDDVVLGLESRSLSLTDLRRVGLDVFTTPFNVHDGFGDGPFDPTETDTRAFGQRPTLQGNGTLLRINGLDAQSCNECHTIVSSLTRPPELGIGGVGGMTQNAIIGATLIDVADSADQRVQYLPGESPDLHMVNDGVADFNGRFANPPFLFGGGGVELLAKEMTRNLQATLAQAQQAPAGTVLTLETHGIDFGEITSRGDGSVDLNVEGIGFEDNAGRPAEEVLVVRPFGRKGENFSMRDFDRGAMQFHFGIQPNEVVGEGVDGDGDGLMNEVTAGEMTALHLFDVTNPPPVARRLNRQARRGFDHFMAIGCGDCHVPEIISESRSLPLAFPEIAEDPDANVYYEVDLRRVGFTRASGGGLVIPLFADLKRHPMGPGLAETFSNGEIANDEFTTARLWGVADTAPYLHDGRATTLEAAIELHGGAAQAARDAFVDSSVEEKSQLIEFLTKLRTPNAPNEELLSRRR